MTTSDPLREVTQLLRDAVADPGDVDRMPEGRDAAIAGIAGALRARGRARRRKGALATRLLAAAVVLIVGGGAFAVHRAHRGAAAGGTADATGSPNLGHLVAPTGAVTALRDGRSESVSGGVRLAEGTELRTSGEAEASLDFDNGTHVTLGGAARVRLVEQTSRKRFALEAGSFSAKVAKLKADERFVVTTPDAEVEVRGTAFRVTIVAGDPTCESGTPTRLEVSEGVVVVTHAGAQVNVSAGERWPACSIVAAAPVMPTVPQTATATSVPRHPPAQPPASSHLAEQNDLFDEAMRLKRSGDLPGSLVKLDRLLSEYPAGPLAESAAMERKRLLSTLDKDRP